MEWKGNLFYIILSAGIVIGMIIGWVIGRSERVYKKLHQEVDDF